MARLSNDEITLALTAVRALMRIGVTAAQVATILNGPEPTEETVRAALDRVDSAIDNARKD